MLNSMPNFCRMNGFGEMIKIILDFSIFRPTFAALNRYE